MWNKTTYPFLVQALCIIPLKSIRMWASLGVFVFKELFTVYSAMGIALIVVSVSLVVFQEKRKRV